jgi:MULE transposase-like protein
VANWQEIDGRLTALFFASVNQIELMRCFPDVILLDATYKTNRYGMPLLHIGGTTPMNTFFSSAFCSFSGESEEDYFWAIQRFNEVLRVGIKQPEVIVTDND